MSSIHLARQGFVTKSALPSVSRERGTTTSADNQTVLLLNGNGTNGAQNNTFLDSSTNNFSITRNGNATQGSFSPFTLPDGQWSNFFDGNGDYLTVGNINFGSGAFTIEGWFYATALPTSGNQGQIFATPWGNNNNIQVYINPDSTIRWQSFTFGGNGTFPTFSLNTWNHFAVVKNGSTASIYLNGVLGQSGTMTNAPSATAYIGSRFTDTTQYFTGYLSNIRVVIGTALYTSNFTPPTTPLTAISGTALLTCQSNRFIDKSSNNFALTRNGDVRVTPWSPFAPTSAYDPATNGGSGYFDGTGDYVTAPDNAAVQFGSGDFTIEFWAYPNNNNSWWILGKGDAASASGSAISFYNGGTWDFYYGSSALSVTRPTFTTGVWQHIAVVRNGATITIYKDGVSVSTGNIGTNSINTGGSNPVSIGFYASSAFNGYLSNLRIVKGTAVYTSAFTPPTAPVTNITNTSLLLNFTNAGIFDTAGDQVLETVADAKISTSVKKYGSGSLMFDGNTDGITIPVTPLMWLGSQNFTFEGWFMRNQTGRVDAILRGDTGGSGGTGLDLFFDSSNNLRMDLNGGTTTLVSVPSGTHNIQTGVWYHIAFVRNGNTWSIYVDGVLRGSTTNSSSVGNPTFYRLGANSFSTSFSFNGYMDDVRFTVGRARYTANFTPPTSELVVVGTVPNIVTNSTYGVYQLA